MAKIVNAQRPSIGDVVYQNVPNCETSPHHQFDGLTVKSGSKALMSTSIEDSGKVKMKIITTQIPQSLLLSNPMTKANSEQHRHLIFNHASAKKGQDPQGKPLTQANLVNSFLVPTKQVKQKGSGLLGSMPPSLTAINVQQTHLSVRDTSQNAIFQGNKNSLANKRSIVKKKASQTSLANQQMKLLRRQIQFYQKRCAERHLPPMTGKEHYVTRRILFKRRARMAEQNLIIVYFDGVLGDICTKSNALGHFRVRKDAFTGLRRIFNKY